MFLANKLAGKAFFGFVLLQPWVLGPEPHTESYGRDKKGKMEKKKNQTNKKKRNPKPNNQFINYCYLVLIRLYLRFPTYKYQNGELKEG